MGNLRDVENFYSMRQNVIIDQTPPSLTQTCLTGYYIE